MAVQAYITEIDLLVEFAEQRKSLPERLQCYPGESPRQLLESFRTLGTMPATERRELLIQENDRAAWAALRTIGVLYGLKQKIDARSKASGNALSLAEITEVRRADKPSDTGWIEPVAAEPTHPDHVADAALDMG